MIALDSNGYTIGQWRYKPRGQLYKKIPSRYIRGVSDIVEKYGMRWSSSKEINRYRNRQKARLWDEWSIVFAEHSTPLEPLEISQANIEHALDRAAEYMRENTSASIGNIFLQAVMAIAGIALTVFSFGTASALSAGLMIGASALSTTTFLLDVFYFQNEQIKATASAISTTLLRNEFSKRAMQSNVELDSKGRQIALFMCFATNEIFANGSIYNAGRAGSESYTPTQAHNPNKGILVIMQTQFIDEILCNRAQTSMAGGVAYMQTTLSTPMPLAQSTDPLSIDKERLSKEQSEWAKRINSALATLTRQGFGLNARDGFLDEVLQTLQKTHLTRRAKRECDIDTQSKAKNYNAGLKAQSPQQPTFLWSNDKKAKQAMQKENAFLRGFNAIMKQYNTLDKIIKSRQITLKTLQDSLPSTKDERQKATRNAITQTQELLASLNQAQQSAEKTLELYVNSYNAKEAFYKKYTDEEIPPLVIDYKNSPLWYYNEDTGQWQRQTYNDEYGTPPPPEVYTRESIQTREEYFTLKHNKDSKVAQYNAILLELEAQQNEAMQKEQALQEILQTL